MTAGNAGTPSVPSPAGPLPPPARRRGSSGRLIDKGHNPAGEKRQRREAPTVQDLINRYLEQHLPRKSASTVRQNDERTMLAEIGQKLGRHTKAADVHGGDIRDMHERITASGRPVRANRILAICSKMFSLSLVPMPGENTPWRSAPANGSLAKPSSRRSAMR